MRFEQESLHSTLHQRHKMVIALIPYFCDEFWRKFELNGHTPILPNLFSISLKPQFVPAFSIANVTSGLSLKFFGLSEIRSHSPYFQAKLEASRPMQGVMSYFESRNYALGGRPVTAKVLVS